MTTAERREVFGAARFRIVPRQPAFGAGAHSRLVHLGSEIGYSLPCSLQRRSTSQLHDLISARKTRPFAPTERRLRDEGAGRG